MNTMYVRALGVKKERVPCDLDLQNPNLVSNLFAIVALYVSFKTYSDAELGCNVFFHIIGQFSDVPKM